MLNQKTSKGAGAMTELIKNYIEKIQIGKGQSYKNLTLYQRLIKYEQIHGNCNVPSGWLNDPQLASWVVKQRQSKKKGLLKKERMKKLDEIGMRW
jgi:hypothetical protein